MSKEYLNASLAPEKRAKALLEEMSLEEKAAQLTGVFPFDEEYKDFDGISKRVPHGIGEVSTLEMRRMETLEEVAAWQKKVQEIVMENSEHHIPAIFHMEGLCGPFIQDSTSFPAGIGRGAGFDPEVEEKIAEIVSRQEAACGITHILAPVLDISRDSRMGRQGETYGEDPALASAMGAAYTKGIQTKQEEKQKVLPNIFWPSIIPMEESTELSVIHRQDFWKKFMENHFRLQSRSLTFWESCLVTAL